MAAVRSSDHFLCSVCLEVFTDPVSTTCGHTFCKTCLSQVWESAPYRCPLCKEIFNIKPELRINTFIKETVSQFRLGRSDSMERIISLSEDSSPASVLCDVCSDPKLKALKSCLVCLASFCETHLQPHLTVSGLKRHQLMEPVEDLEDRICPKLHKPLELFCRTDHSCICTICSTSEHQDHQVVPVEEEAQRRRSSLQQTQAQTQLMVEQRRLKIREIGRSLELSDKAVDRERTSGLQAFSALIQSVQRRQQEFIKELQEQHKHTHTQAQELVSELQQEICELEKTGSEVSHSEDHLHLIQRHRELRSTADRWDMKDWSRVHFETRTYEGSAARALADTEKKLTEDCKRLSVRLELHRVQQFAVDLPLDPDTAHPKLHLSKDLKQVHHTNMRKDLPDSPVRFDYCPCVLSKQSFSSGRFYFEVWVKRKTDWDLGVAQESANRKGNIPLSPKNGYWTMWLRNTDEYKALADPPVRLYPRCPPQKVGVFVDYSGGLVSFFDVDSGDLLFSFTGCTFKERLLPYFGPYLNNGGTNSTPLVITAV